MKLKLTQIKKTSWSSEYNGLITNFEGGFSDAVQFAFDSHNLNADDYWYSRCGFEIEFNDAIGLLNSFDDYELGDPIDFYENERIAYDDDLVFQVGGLNKKYGVFINRGLMPCSPDHTKEALVYLNGFAKKIRSFYEMEFCYSARVVEKYFFEKLCNELSEDFLSEI